MGFIIKKEGEIKVKKCIKCEIEEDDYELITIETSSGKAYICLRCLEYISGHELRKLLENERIL